MLALSLAQGAEGPVRPGATLVLGHLEILPEQIGGDEPGIAPLGEILGRATGRWQSRLRYPVLRNFAAVQDLGRRRPSEGRHLELPATRRSDRVGLGLAGASPHREPDLRA